MAYCFYNCLGTYSPCHAEQARPLSFRILVNTHTSLSTPSICDRDSGHASTSYDSPRFARHSSGVSFTSRRSDPRGYSPSYSQDRYADQYADSSSTDSRQGNSMAADDESSDEGELRPVNRLVSGLYHHHGKHFMYWVRPSCRISEISISLVPGLAHM